MAIPMSSRGRVEAVEAVATGPYGNAGVTDKATAALAVGTVQQQYKAS